MCNKIRFIVLFSLLIAIFSTVSAQEWTDEQKEVLEIVLKMNNYWADRDLEGYMSCLHENFIGWYHKDPFPIDKNILQSWEKHWLGTIKIHLDEMKPVSINITGNTAIINLYGITLEEDESGKKLRYSKWTVVTTNENGKWLIIGMMGGNILTD